MTGTQDFSKRAFELTKPLSVLFQKSLDADVVPVFKEGNRKLPSNYRPINLTPVICKVLELVIRNKVFEHLIVVQPTTWLCAKTFLCNTTSYSSQLLDRISREKYFC